MQLMNPPGKFLCSGAFACERFRHRCWRSWMTGKFVGWIVRCYCKTNLFFKNLLSTRWKPLLRLTKCHSKNTCSCKYIYLYVPEWDAAALWGCSRIMCVLVKPILRMTVLQPRQANRHGVDVARWWSRRLSPGGSDTLKLYDMFPMKSHRSAIEWL